MPLLVLNNEAVFYELGAQGCATQYAMWYSDSSKQKKYAFWIKI